MGDAGARRRRRARAPPPELQDGRRHREGNNTEVGNGIIELVYNNKTVPMRTLNITEQLALYPEVITVMLYQFVERQCRTDTTRIADSIPLRENWALPCFAVQVAGLTGFIRHNRNIKVERFGFSVACAASYTLIMMWEYSHYLLFVQALTLCLLDGLALINKDKMYEINLMYLASVSSGYLFQFLNSKLLISPLLSLVLASMLATKLQATVRPGTFQPKVMTMIYFCLTFTLSLATHFLIGILVTQKDDDQILKSVEVKLGLKTNKDFTVNWLLCQESFQPLSQDCLSRLTQSSLLPFYILVSIICLVSMCLGLFKNRANLVHSTSEDCRIGERLGVNYHVFQSLILGLFAMNFEGLKYLWTPYVCVLAASGVCSPALWLTVFRWIRLRAVNPVVLALLLSAVVPALIGFSLWREFSPKMVGESTDMEEHYESDTMEVMNWIKTQAPATAVFAGSPALMGAIKLCTGRMVTSLPVYNDEELMKRNEDMYQLYSMRSAEDIYKILTTYKASYVVLEESICNELFKMNNCRVKDLLDIGNGHVVIEDEDIFAYLEYGRFCQEIKTNYLPYVNYFTRVYWNRSYFIYKINTVVSFQS
ncbi:putative C-mannosyltransferase DPY19L4 [Anomaloglossus baeobatrachus]|uniref:putative C-mannosyltransferase DPY19L4 n=1 Tax=Anomaloglossus baeobatrachus TaxID=238106 RepID=UPI003F50CEA0